MRAPTASVLADGTSPAPGYPVLLDLPSSSAFHLGMATGCLIWQTFPASMSKLVYQSFFIPILKSEVFKAYENIHMAYIWILKNNSKIKSYEPTNQKKKLALSLYFQVLSKSLSLLFWFGLFLNFIFLIICT